MNHNDANIMNEKLERIASSLEKLVAPKEPVKIDRTLKAPKYERIDYTVL